MRTLGNDFQPKENFINNITSIDYLIRQYPDESLIPQFKKLQLTYPYYRPVRGDGNCFYRAIAFMYLRQANLDRLSNAFQSIQDVCEGHSLYFEDQSFQQTLYNIYQEYLSPLSNIQPIQRQNQLYSIFNKSMVFDTTMIIYFRSLNYHYIKYNENQLGEFITSKQSIERVRMYGKDSQGIEYYSMACALNIDIDIKIVDQNRLSTQSYNINKYQQSNNKYDLFLRPGHFDILYHKDSKYLQKIKQQFKNNPYRSPQLNLSKRLNNNRPDQTYQYRQNNQDLQKKRDQLYQYTPQNPQLQTPLPSFRINNYNQKSISTKSKPFQPMNNLRSFKPLQNKQQTPLKSSLKNFVELKQKPKDEDSFSKTKFSLQKYKAFQCQTVMQSEPWKKLKQIAVLILFAATLGFIYFKF